MESSTERQLAADLFNGVWRLMETEDRSPAQDDRLLHMAHHARRVVELCEEHGIGDWDLGVPVADDEDRALLLADLDTVPGTHRPV